MARFIAAAFADRAQAIPRCTQVLHTHAFDLGAPEWVDDPHFDIAHHLHRVALPQPGEPVYAKSVNSAFIGTTLEDDLRSRGLDSLVLVGLTTDHCVSTSVRMAANLGFAVTVVADATATFDRVSYDGASFDAEQMHQAALASLQPHAVDFFCTNEWSHANDSQRHRGRFTSAGGSNQYHDRHQ